MDTRPICGRSRSSGKTNEIKMAANCSDNPIVTPWLPGPLAAILKIKFKFVDLVSRHSDWTNIWPAINIGQVTAGFFGGGLHLVWRRCGSFIFVFRSGGCWITKRAAQQISPETTCSQVPIRRRNCLNLWSSAPNLKFKLRSEFQMKVGAQKGVITGLSNQRFIF